MGRRLDDETIDEAAALGAQSAKPLDNTDFDLTWRKRAAKRFVEVALKEIRGDDMRATRQTLSRLLLA